MLLYKYNITTQLWLWLFPNILTGNRGILAEIKTKFTIVYCFNYNNRLMYHFFLSLFHIDHHLYTIWDSFYWFLNFWYWKIQVSDLFLCCERIKKVRNSIFLLFISLDTWRSESNECVTTVSYMCAFWAHFLCTTCMLFECY